MAVCLALGLAACGKGGGGAGVSAGSDSGSSADSSERLSREAKQLVALFRTDAAPFIIDTIAHGIDRSKIDQVMSYMIMNPDARDVVLDPSPELVKAYVDGWQNQIGKNPEQLKKIQEIATKDNPIAAHQLEILNDSKKLEGAFIKEMSRMMLIRSVMPFAGWNVNPISGNKRDLAVYVNGLSGLALYSNEILTQLAEPLKNHVFANEEDARRAILNKWIAMPPETIRDTWLKKYKHIAPANTVLDTASGHGVNWVNAEGAFQNDERGMVILRNGQPYFGQGYLSGQKVELALANSSKASMEKSKTIEQGVGAEQKSGSGASVNPR